MTHHLVLAGALVSAMLAPSPARAIYVAQVYQAAIASFHDVEVTVPGQEDPEPGYAFVLAVRSIGVRNRPVAGVETGPTSRCIQLHADPYIEIGCGASDLGMSPDLFSATASGTFPSTVCDAETGDIVASSTISYAAWWIATGSQTVNASTSAHNDLDSPNPVASVNISRPAQAGISISSTFFGVPAANPTDEGALFEGVDSAPLFPYGSDSCGVSAV